MVATKEISRFVTGLNGSLFAFEVTPQTKPVACAIFLPPHGEEMNRCRSLMAAQARALAQKSISCLVLDYYGTGDSEGGFEDSRWSDWLKDIHHVLKQWCDDSSIPVMMIGFRLGALVAFDYLQQYPDTVAKLMLIQPVITGKSYVTQLLRQRMAYLMSNELPSETTTEMREKIDLGETLEIGGYVFGSQLLADVDQQQLSDKTAITEKDIYWLENVAHPDKPVAVGSLKAVGQLQNQNNNVKTLTFTGPPIWQLHDRAEAEDCLRLLSNIEFNWS